ncbi:hypothetical protein PIB30_041981 [Stylosanthes scabra]|uniref:Exocyst subunit Exo70 family protein n=1 Tax=Stylosanthes scabra TaxID=79078 RepID=A0ABU6YFQ9_9FABA|nr:hypothetical protein [Stylosanthes scabra]
MASLLNEIQRCMRQAHVWKLVGLASTTVGLSCYALSSSFNRLFGSWNFLKIFIYILSSVIICFLILSAKRWQCSTTLRFKAHLSFLALTITAIYSFFLDKDVNGKPDVCSLISCASFAVMSLCLSKQIHFGFEVDLLYFFLGALIVQLMKIHLFLVVQVDSDSQQQFIACMEALKSCDWELMNMLSNYAKDYIKNLLESNYHQDHVLVDANQVIDALPLNIINDLQEAVKFMLANGFEKECCDLYSSSRSEYIENFVSNLVFKLPDIVNVAEVESIALEFEVRNWISTSNLALRFLFPNERRLCQRIFLGFTSVADTVFTEICREFTIRQLNFADCFTFESSNFKTFEVFPMSVKVFMALHDLIPEYESLFSEQLCDSIRNEAINTWKRLGKATKGIFMELEDWICNDKTISDVPGSLYPICSKVIECLNAVYKAWVILPLENFFEEHPMVVYRKGSPSSFFIQLIRITELLETHLEVKFKSCPDRALRYIIAMNNIRHVEQNARKWNSETRPMYNSGMIRKLNAKFRQNLEDYLKVSWDEVIGLLKLGNNESYSVECMKENLKLFNLHLKEICRVQSTWFVLDKRLRKEIRESINNVLLPIYGVFIGKLYNVLGSHANEYIEYSMLDIDALLNDLFRA